MINPKDKVGMKKVSLISGNKKEEIKSKQAGVKPEIKQEHEHEEEMPEQRRFGSIFASILPLREEDKTKLALVQDYFEPEELGEVKYLLKTHKARFAEADFDTSHDFFQSSKYLTFACNVIDEAVKNKVDALNHRIMT
jgi:hypothetical protein